MIIQRMGKRYVFMQEAGGSGSDGGGGAAGSQSNPAGAGAGTGSGSVLAAGAGGEGGAGAENFEYIPEKYRVNKEDGTLDLAASSQKLAEAYSSAEKRIGSGDIPPKSAEEYTVEIPEEFKESWKPDEDDQYKDFRAKAHAAGMTQKQMDLVMSQYFQLAPQLTAGAAILDQEAATAELRKVWATDSDFTRNVQHAYAGADALAQKAGLKIDAIMASPLGNDPTFLRLMAAIGPELKEDRAPTDKVMASQDEVQELMRSEAYSDPNHKDHKAISEKVRKYFEKKHGTEAAG